MARRALLAAGLGLGLLTPGVAGAEELTKANFEEKVFGSGKSAFIKFLAPWCGHCKSMKPAWDKLGETFKDSTSVLIADVDCTTDEAKSVCTDHGVSGYPTIKYFTAETGNKGEDYSGGRSFEDLESFTKEKLSKRCDPQTKEDCDDKEKAYIDKMSGKDGASLKKEADRIRGMKGGDMKDDKKQWLLKRIAILDGLTGSKGEL